jgi:hypothetical protein
MFAWKSMDVNSNLVKLKLDMVYRNLSEEMASQAFTEITQPVLPAIEIKEKPKTKKKIVKVALPKSK